MDDIINKANRKQLSDLNNLMRMTASFDAANMVSIATGGFISTRENRIRTGYGIRHTSDISLKSKMDGISDLDAAKILSIASYRRQLSLELHWPSSAYYLLDIPKTVIDLCDVLEEVLKPELSSIFNISVEDGDPSDYELGLNVFGDHSQVVWSSNDGATVITKGTVLNLMATVRQVRDSWEPLLVGAVKTAKKESAPVFC